MLSRTKINRNSHLVFWPVLAGSFLFCFWKALSALVHMWLTVESQSHGFLIPLISLYLVWLKRDELFKTGLKPNILGGIPILLIGVAAFIAGRTGSVMILQSFSIIVSLTGLIIATTGLGFFRKIWFPVLYLLFMIPVPGVITNQVQPSMQFISATIGYKLLHLFGIPVHQNGVFLELPNVTLEVAKVCSGVNYITSIIAISIPLAYLFLSRWWKRALFIATGLLVAILSNGLRIFFIGFYAVKVGVHGGVHGPLDLFRALFVSVVGFIVLFVLLAFIADKKPGKKGNPGAGTNETSLASRDFPPTKSFYLPVSISLMILILTGAYSFNYRVTPVPLKRSLKEFPIRIGSWSGEDVKVDTNVFESLGVDEELSRKYVNKEGDEVRLYVGYFREQRQGKELINYQMLDLFRNSSTMRITFKQGLELNANIGSMENGSRPLIFWFDVAGRHLSDKYHVKLFTIWEALMKGRTNGSVVVIEPIWRNGEDALSLKNIETIKDFIEESYPFLQDIIQS